MRLLICGGRNYSNALHLCAVLNQLIAERGRPEMVIHGGAKGADSLADKWARGHGIYTRVYHAAWRMGGRAAGPARNRIMISDGQPDLVVVFPGGAGTRNMRQLALTAGIEVIDVEDVSDMQGNQGRGCIPDSERQQEQ